MGVLLLKYERWHDLGEYHTFGGNTEACLLIQWALLSDTDTGSRTVTITLYCLDWLTHNLSDSSEDTNPVVVRALALGRLASSYACPTTDLITQAHGKRPFSLVTHDFVGCKKTQTKRNKQKGGDSSSTEKSGDMTTFYPILSGFWGCY